MFTMRFELRDQETKKYIGEIEMDLSVDGDIEGLFIEGEDFTDNGEVIQAVVGLVGEEYIARRCSEKASGF